MKTCFLNSVAPPAVTCSNSRRSDVTYWVLDAFLQTLIHLNSKSTHDVCSHSTEQSRHSQLTLPNGFFLGSWSRWEMTLLASFWMYESLEARSMSTNVPLIQLKHTHRDGNYLRENINTFLDTRGWNTAGRGVSKPGRSNSRSGPPPAELCGCYVVGCLITFYLFFTDVLTQHGLSEISAGLFQQGAHDAEETGEFLSFVFNIPEKLHWVVWMSCFQLVFCCCRRMSFTSRGLSSCPDCLSSNVQTVEMTLTVFNIMMTAVSTLSFMFMTQKCTRKSIKKIN